MVANHALLLAALSSIVASSPFPTFKLRARSYDTLSQQSTAIVSIVSIAYVQNSLLSSSTDIFPTENLIAASATLPLVVAASGPPDLTAIVPLRPYTFLSTEAAVTFHNTAGSPVVTVRPTTLATTTLVPYSSLVISTDTSPIEVRLSSVFGSDTSTAMLEAYFSTSSIDTSSMPTITGIANTSPALASSSSSSSIPVDTTSSSFLSADSTSALFLPVVSANPTAVLSFTTPFSTMPVENITSSSMPVENTKTSSMFVDITSSISVPTDSVTSSSMPSSTGFFGASVSATLSSIIISSVTGPFSTLSAIVDSSLSFSASSSIMPSLTSSFTAIISNTGSSTIAFTVTSSPSPISVAVDPSTGFPFSSGSAAAVGPFGSTIDASSAASSTYSVVSIPLRSTGTTSDSTYIITDIPSIQPSLSFSGLYSTSTPVPSNAFSFPYYSRNFSLSTPTSIILGSTQPVTTLLATSTTQIYFPIYTTSSVLSSMISMSSSLAVPSTDTAQPIESSAGSTILASDLPTYYTGTLPSASLQQPVPSGYSPSSFTSDSSTSTSSVANTTTPIFMVQLTSTTTTTLPATTSQPITTYFPKGTSTLSEQAGAASVSSALSGPTFGVTSTYPPVAYPVQVTSSGTPTQATLHLDQSTLIQSPASSSPSLIPTSAAYTTFGAAPLLSSTFVLPASSKMAQTSQFAFDLPFAQTTVSSESLHPPFSVYLLPSETSQSILPSSATTNAAGITIVPINPVVFTMTVTEMVTEHVTDTVTQIMTTTVA